MSWGMDDDELEAEDLEADDADEETTEVEGDTTEDTSDDAGGWGSDVQDLADGDDRDDETEEELGFAQQFASVVDAENVESITVSTIEDKYKELDDADVLREAMEQDTRSSAQEVYERRLNQVEDDADEDAGNDSDATSQNEDDETQDETSDDESTDDSGGWGMDDEDDGATQDEVDDAVDEVDPDELDEIGVDNLADEDTSDTTEQDDEPETTQTASVDDDVSSIGAVDIGDVAPNAMDTDEAAEQPYLWRILGWAEPGKGKTHFGFTMPQPVCIIDTEGKAHNLASKFEDKVTYIWQPDDYDEAREALNEAISVLHRYLEEGHRGTIVVDSMSEMWEWSKQKYVSKAYQGKTLDEVNLSSNMGRSGESDWKVIKRYHNKRFREVMIDTPFHFYWTAMQTDDYEAIMEGDEGNPKKPVGERDNAYKVDQVLRFVEGPDGEPVGQLQKNGLSKYSYTGLRYPTFDKHEQVCEEIRDLEEEGKDPMLEEVLDGDVRVVEGNPGRWSDD
ncbi:hypothetical protein HCTV5_99 [Halovirus HCTV-5]|uniref:hypothetical protein n=1 Tax=Halovirus HCTV-5 TaxID=1273748 RepID=UPI0003348245|nr:hypothetical protein M200_gp126 [Halovirus HCTV-5]AGM11708.1 hypothetical protein HCTV5_99 [Halovirus HCTV-5]